MQTQLQELAVKTIHIIIQVLQILAQSLNTTPTT